MGDHRRFTRFIFVFLLVVFLLVLASGNAVAQTQKPFVLLVSIDGLRPDNVFRADELRPSLTPAAALAGAPATEDQRFRVPRILDEE